MVSHFLARNRSSLYQPVSLKQLTSIVLVKANEMGIQATTNISVSTLSREADMTMLLHAGPESTVASTKAYTA